MPEHNLQFLFLSTLMDFSIKILSSQYQADKVISVTNILHSLRYLLTKVTSVWVWVKSEWDTQHSARRMMKRQSENLKQTKGGRGGSVRRFQILPRQTERQYLNYIHYLWLSDLPVWQYVIIIKTYKSRSYKRHVQDSFMWHKLRNKTCTKDVWMSALT